MSNLVKTGENAAIARKLKTEVVSTANPEAPTLLTARELIKKNSDLQEAFGANQVDRAYLAERIRMHYYPDNPRFNPEDPRYDEEKALHFEAQLQEVITYLSDEHEQIGDGILVLSPKTGRAIAKLTDEDFYQPAPVPRETGGMVTLAPRVKPEIESAILEAQSAGEHDQRVHEHMLSRVPMGKTFLPEVAARKALFVTRGGRGAVASMVHDRLPRLIQEAKGIAGDFFQLFALDAPPPDGCESMPIEPVARVRVGVQDGMAQNMSYDMVAASSAVVVAGWARAVACTILTKAAQWESFEVSEVMGEGLFLASANTAQYIHGRTLVVDGPDGLVVCLRGPSGSLQAGDYSTRWREVHGKWTLESFFQGTLFIDWSAIQVLHIADVAATGIVVEMTH